MSVGRSLGLGRTIEIGRYRILFYSTRNALRTTSTLPFCNIQLYAGKTRVHFNFLTIAPIRSITIFGFCLFGGGNRLKQGYLNILF